MTKVNFAKIYSYSKLDLFKKCKRQYYFSYLDPKIAPIKKQLRRIWDFNTVGRAVHDAITLFYHLPEEQRTLPSLKDQLKLAWFSELDKYKKPPLGKLGGFESLDHERAKYKEALVLLENFFNLKKENPNIFYLPTQNIKNSISDYIDLVQPLNEAFDVSGKIDRIDKLNDNSLCIIDYKTGKENEGDNFQLRFYKLLAELNFRKPVKKVSFYFLKAPKIKDFDLPEEDIEEIKGEILAKIAQIGKEKDFEPNVTARCKFCDFIKFCPAREKPSRTAGKIEIEATEEDLPF